MSRTILSETPTIETPTSNIWSVLYPRLQQFKNRTAVICEKTKKTYTYDDVINGSLRWSKKLISLRQGSIPPVLAVLSSNIAEFSMIILGAIASGTPICPILTSYTEEIMAYILTHSKASVIVVEESLTKKLANVQTMLKKPLKTFVVGPVRDGAGNFLDIIADGAIDASAIYETDPEETSFIIFSSGTTGDPKGIIHSQNSILKSFYLLSRAYFFNIDRQGDVQQSIITSMPMVHSLACQIYCLLTCFLGDQLIVVNYTDFDELIQSTKKYHPKLLYLRSFNVAALTEFENAKEILSHVKVLALIGSVPNKAILEELHNIVPHIKFIDSYGLTECNGISFSPLSNDPLDLRMKLMANTKLEIRDVLSQEPLGPNKLGEILIHTPSLMKGYLDNPDATREVIEKDGWFHTGDIGFYSEENYISLVDRTKDVIIVSGKIVFPTKVEAILKQHPHVLDVGVIGTPRLLEGQVPRAYVVLKDDKQATVDKDDLVSYLNERVTYPEEKLEGGVRIVQSLPRNPMGKILKRTLRIIDWNEEN